MNQLLFPNRRHEESPACHGALKFFMKVLIEHQGRCAQINECQRFSQRPVWTDEIEFSKYAIVIKDKRNGSAPLCVESFQRARKKDDNQQEDLSPYESWLHSNESYTRPDAGNRSVAAFSTRQLRKGSSLQRGFYALNYRSFVIRHFPPAL